MKECLEVRDSLSAYIDDELAWDEREAIESHLAECPACSAELESLRRTVQVCGQLEEVEVPTEVRAAIMASVRGKSLARKRRFFPVMTAVAAVLVVAIGIGVGVGLGVNPLAPFQGKDARLAGREGPDVFPSVAPAPPPISMGVPSDPQFTTVEATKDQTKVAGIQPYETVLRMIIKRADVLIEVPRGTLQEMERRAVSFVEAVGGFVQRSSTWEEDTGRKVAGITARVPEDAFTHVLNQFDGLGKQKYRNVDSEDVTERYIDLQAHVRNREAQEARLREIMQQAKNVSEIMQVENELQRIRADIDASRGRLRYYESAAAMSTITLTLREEGTPGVTPPPTGFWWDIYQAFLGSVKALAMFVARLAPYLVLLALGGLAFMAGRRRQ